MNQMTLNVLTDEQLESLASRIVAKAISEAKRLLEKRSESKMMTTKEVMDWYRCGRSTIYIKIKKGELHPQKVGGKNLFREDEVKFYENEDISTFKQK